jgi:hypothetical protein
MQHYTRGSPIGDRLFIHGIKSIETRLYGFQQANHLAPYIRLKTPGDCNARTTRARNYNGFVGKIYSPCRLMDVRHANEKGGFRPLSQPNL